MAFAANVLVNGEWTTRNLDVDTILRHFNQKDKEITDSTLLQDREVAPTLGILSQTVIPSPLVHWILPARLRDINTHDVAFIGDDFVQIREFGSDGNLHDVIRKEGFGSRIRNARIVGTFNDPQRLSRFISDDLRAKDEDDDFYMDSEGVRAKTNGGTMRVLPPQVILLQLSTGDSVFLILQTSENGALEFASSCRRVSKPMLKLQPGTHLAVDPSSRYAAIGCSEGVLAVCELYSRDELNEQYSRSSEIQFIESDIHIYPNGAITKMEFLHPAPDDENHIILLVLVASKGRTRMLLYEWETGTGLSQIRPHSTRGHLIDEARQLPLLLIPLTIKSAFILICEDSMSICYGILEGAPVFLDFSNELLPPTRFHYGPGTPLWTSWARPKRLARWAVKGEHIYIAREDGLIKFLELDSTLEEIIKSDSNPANFDANCGTALACLWKDGPDHETSGDVLVMAGDSCSGGTYMIPARRSAKLLGPIQNWSPAHDFVTTNIPNDRDLKFDSNSVRNGAEPLPKPDRIFACVGKGLNGAIVEFHHGLEAKIGLEMDCDTLIDKSWVFNGWALSGSDNKNECLFLLSSGDHSKLLRLASDASEIEELGDSATKFDLRYRTIAASEKHGHIVQVTENSVMISRGSEVKLLEAGYILQIHEGESMIGLGTAIYNAFIEENSIVFTTSFNSIIYLQMLRWEASQNAMEIDDMPTASFDLRLQTLGKYQEYVTCLASCSIIGVPCAVVSQWLGNSISISIQSLKGGEPMTFEIPTSGPLCNGFRFQALASILIRPGQEDTLRMLCGTQNGILIALEVDTEGKTITVTRTNRIGATAVVVTQDSHSCYGFFATCDSKLYALTPKATVGSEFRTALGADDYDIHQFWFTNALEPGMQQPKVTSIANQPPLQFGGNSRDLLLTAGSQILVASLNSLPKAIPRHMLIKGTPSRLLYSPALEILVVATLMNGKSTLLFIDPETGADLSQPVDQRTRQPVKYVSGLGNHNERVYRLFEWKYTKHDKIWNFMIVSTSMGRLLIISVDGQDQVRKDIQNALFQANGNGCLPTRPKINHYTRYKFKSTEPIYSVTGYPDGLLWCAGDKLYCDALDLPAKKFKRVTEYTLPSPATNLSYENGQIYALTLKHSLEILILTTNEEGITEIVRTHGDQITRPSLHHIASTQMSKRPIHLVSDKMNSLVGLWPTKDTMADTLDTVFEASLPYSVLRFRFAKCRPMWDSNWVPRGAVNVKASPLQLDQLQTSAAWSEILGLSITGAVSHYTILDFSTWKFLRFFVDLAIRSSRACEFTYRNDGVPLGVITAPKIMMHIDGDILRRCLNMRLLEELLYVINDTIQAPKIFTRFYELLQELHHGTIESGGKPTTYVSQAYKDLEFFLRPVLQ